MKRLAQKIRVPRLIRDFSGFGEGPRSAHMDDVWIPPGEPEVDGMEGLDLPVPDISTFHVAGFDIKVEPDSYDPDNALRVSAMMHVRLKGDGPWSTVGASGFFLRGGSHMEWRSLIRGMILRTLEHELDESLFFDGEYARAPHPEKRPSVKDAGLKLSDMNEDIRDLLFKKKMVEP